MNKDRKEDQLVPVEQNVMELAPIFGASRVDRREGRFQIDLAQGRYIKIAAVIPEPGESPELICGEDLDVLLVCFLLAKDKKDYEFETSIYQILKFLGEDTSGGILYERVRKALTRLKNNQIETNFWWDTIMGHRVVKTQIQFLDSVAEGTQKSFRVRLNKEIAESLEVGYVKLLGRDLLQRIGKLRGYSKFLALYFIKRIGVKDAFQHNLETVLRLLGVEGRYKKLPRFRFNRNIKKFIIPAVKKAAEAIGFHCTYDKNTQQFHLRKARKLAQMEAPEEESSIEAETDKGPQAKTEGGKTQDPLLTQRRNEAFKRLTDIGVAPEMIPKIFNEFAIDEIERQIEWLPHRRSDNPAAVFVSAIRGHWEMPADYEHIREESLKSRGG
ncbi:hypothetical protein ES702_03261 [subsurface metagenome]